VLCLVTVSRSGLWLSHGCAFEASSSQTIQTESCAKECAVGSVKFPLLQRWMIVSLSKAPLRTRHVLKLQCKALCRMESMSVLSNAPFGVVVRLRKWIRPRGSDRGSHLLRVLESLQFPCNLKQSHIRGPPIAIAAEEGCTKSSTILFDFNRCNNGATLSAFPTCSSGTPYK